MGWTDGQPENITASGKYTGSDTSNSQTQTRLSSMKFQCLKKEKKQQKPVG